jgi:hypothetical protein
MRILNLVVHFIAGAVIWFGGVLALIAGVDYFAAGIELFSDPGSIVMKASIAAVVAVVVALINMLVFFTSNEKW